MYVHPESAGQGGSSLREETRAVFWEGAIDYDRIALRAIVHPTHGDFSFLLVHGVQTMSYLQALICSRTSGSRRCNNQGYSIAVYPDATEAVFASDPVASDPSFDTNNAADMTEATDRIGFVLLFNDASRPGWLYNDDDGSFLLKHKTKPMILAPLRGGGPTEPLTNGVPLVWIACPTDCVADFSRAEYLNLGFVFETTTGAVCLPPGV